MRKRIYEIIEVGKDEDRISKIYDACMMIVIVISLIPLAFRVENAVFKMMDGITVAIFIVDYLLRLITADYKLGKGKISFILYPFSVIALIDLISILPSFVVVNKGIKMLRVARLIRTFRVLRVFKGFRYSKNVDILIKVFKRQKDSLTIVAILAVGYILITALIMFNVEPDTYNNFFDAIYWATVSLTTVGYGDIYAVSDIGKVITMISSLFGIAIVALPAGIITAGYMEEIGQNKEKDVLTDELQERNNEAIYTRRSIRKYEEKPVSKDVLEQIIDAGRVAPSAKNRQPWKYLVYSGKEKARLLSIMKKGIEMEEIKPRLPLSVTGILDAKNTLRIMETAPIVIIVLNTNGKSPFVQLDVDGRFTEMNDLLSIGASIENMLLRAEELNIGSLWIGNTCFAYQELMEYIGTTAELVGAIALGYKAETPAMRPRKMLEDIVKYYD